VVAEIVWVPHEEGSHRRRVRAEPLAKALQRPAIATQLDLTWLTFSGFWC